MGSKTYLADSVIDIEIEITANHRGHFQLKLCPLSSRSREATQDCLDQHPITQLNGDDQFHIYESPHFVRITRKALLPARLTCSRCVMQWTWRSANSWGNCKNGTSGLGCGPQETFRNCADVRIVRTAAELPVTDNPRAIMIRDETSKTGVSPLIQVSGVCCNSSVVTVLRYVRLVPGQLSPLPSPLSSAHVHVSEHVSR